MESTLFILVIALLFVELAFFWWHNKTMAMAQKKETISSDSGNCGSPEGKHKSWSREHSKMFPIDVFDYIYTKWYKPKKIK